MTSMNTREFLAAAAGIGATGLMMAQGAPATGAGARSDTVFNVRDFGAKGDGKTSDTAAIQAALDAAGKVSGTVWFPAGVYPCHALKAPAHVTLKADPVWIFHKDLKGAVLLLDDPSASCLLDITGAYGVHVHGLLLQGIRNTPTPVHGIFLNNATKFSPCEDTLVVEDTKVQEFSGHGIYLKRVWLFIIRHSQCYNNAGSGVMIHGWDGFVTDNQFSGNGGHGFGTEECGATVMFTANRVEWNRGYGLYLCGGDAWNVTGNSFDRNWGAGLCAVGVSASTFTGNLFRRCGKDSRELSEGERSCQVRMEKCSGIAFTGNVCRAGRDDGGKGLFTPQVGFILKAMRCSIVKDNALAAGYMDTLLVDQGGHGPDFVFKDNVGYPMK